MTDRITVIGVSDVPGLLLRARLDAGLTQYEAAERSGVSQPDISQYERGNRLPGLTRVLALLRAYQWQLSAGPRWDRSDR